MAKMMSREEMLAKVRKKMAERSSRSRRDPSEFRPPQIQSKKTAEFYFRILPELNKGDKCIGGECKADADLWYYENGSHWYNKQRTECPRCHDQDPCGLCQFGFDLLEDEGDREVRSRISKNYLATAKYAVNVYFLNTTKNPEEYRGKVLWFNAPRTVWNIWDEVINSDDPGDEEDPKACGIFYHPLEGYTFKLIVKEIIMNRLYSLQIVLDLFVRIRMVVLMKAGLSPSLNNVMFSMRNLMNDLQKR